MLYAFLKIIVSFSQSINQSPNVSPNDQRLFAKAVKNTTAKLPHKFAQTAQIQVANITGRFSRATDIARSFRL